MMVDQEPSGMSSPSRKLSRQWHSIRPPSLDGPERPGPSDEFDWSEIELYGFLGTRLDSQSAATDAIAEADEKGTVTRTIEYALGNTARIVISRAARP